MDNIIKSFVQELVVSFHVDFVSRGLLFLSTNENHVKIPKALPALLLHFTKRKSLQCAPLRGTLCTHLILFFILLALPQNTMSQRAQKFEQYIKRLEKNTKRYRKAKTQKKKVQKEERIKKRKERYGPVPFYILQVHINMTAK